MQLVFYCKWCNWYLGNRKCKAFPLGIPEDILVSEFDHRKSHKGDHGVQFEPIKED